MTNRLPGLGDKVRHKITGFEGVIVTHATHLTGCDRMWVEPRTDRDGKLVNGAWFDIDMLEIIEANVVEVVKYSRVAPGGVDLPRSR